MTRPTTRTLADLVRAGGLGASAIEVMRPVAAALDALHDDGRVHRGVRPESVEVAEDGTVTLAPPPSADTAPGAEASVDRTGTLDVVDEAVYLAPEQAGRAIASHRSDVYAFAAVAFEAVTGTPAFTTSTLPDQAAGTVPAVSTRAPGVPPTVDEVFRAALTPVPERRPSSASAVVDELAAAFGGQYRPRAGRALRWLVVVSAVAAALAVAALVLVLLVVQL
jgi:serine/threonine protein kinase